MRRMLRDVRATPSHFGLAYDIWAPSSEGDGKVPDDKKADWLDRIENIEVSEHYPQAYRQWESSFTQNGDRLAKVTLESRLLLGHGNPSATEVGLTVHHTWGVPILSGSALKGILAHYIGEMYGPSDKKASPWEHAGEEKERAAYRGVAWDGTRIKFGPGEVYRALLGAPDAEGDKQMREHNLSAGAARGLVTFHDALYVPSGGDNKPFAADVLTVHQSEYYNSTGGSPANDFDSPTPVGFISVKPGVHFLIALSGPSGWTDLAAALLRDALSEWGIGGKTSAGYGRLVNWREQTIRMPESAELKRFRAWIDAPVAADGAPLPGAQGTGKPTARAMLTEVKASWQAPLLALPAHELDIAAKLIEKHITSPKIRAEKDLLIARLLKEKAT